MSILEYFIGGNRVIVDDDARRLWTVFPDGSGLYAAANHDAESLALARELGYPDTWEMSRAHELTHSYLAVLVGEPHSPTLWTVAHPGEPRAASAEARAIEEWLVIEFQRYLNTGTLHDGPPLSWLTERGLDLAALRDEAIERFRPSSF